MAQIITINRGSASTTSQTKISLFNTPSDVIATRLIVNYLYFTKSSSNASDIRILLYAEVSSQFNIIGAFRISSGGNSFQTGAPIVTDCVNSTSGPKNIGTLSPGTFATYGNYQTPSTTNSSCCVPKNIWVGSNTNIGITSSLAGTIYYSFTLVSEN